MISSGSDDPIPQVRVPRPKPANIGLIGLSTTNQFTQASTVPNWLPEAEATGALPENVNFAINEGTARAFLDANNVPYDVKPSISDHTVPSADMCL